MAAMRVKVFSSVAEKPINEWLASDPGTIHSVTPYTQLFEMGFLFLYEPRVESRDRTSAAAADSTARPLP